MAKKYNAGFCVLDEKAGPVTLKITVDKDLMAGGQFIIDKAGNTGKVDSWRVSAEKGESVNYTIKATTSILHTSIMSWQILCCVTKVSVRTGFIKFEAFQSGNVCRITEGADFEINDPSPCVVNNPTDFSGSMTFIVRSDQKMKPLSQI